MTDTLENFTYNELTIGQTATFERTLSTDDIILFATVSGDNNPVHVDADYAARSPFKAPIAHGMWTGSLISAAIATQLPGPGSIYLGQELSFANPVKVDDTVTVTLTIAEKLEKNVVMIDCKAVNQHGETVVEGLAKVRAGKKKISVASPTLPDVRINA